MTANLIERAKAALENATPGPWLVPDQTWRRSLTVEVTGDALVQCPGSGGAMSYTEEICNLSWQGTPEWDANARLIALAPDLARALIREREAAEELAEACSKFNAAIDNPLGRPGAARAVMLSVLAAYRKATKESDDG